MNNANLIKTTSKDKKLSLQVKEILQKEGFSFLFNWSDYKHFKKQTKKNFNRAFQIASLFISESCQTSDFSEYEY